MDSHQRQKITRTLLDLFKNPEVASIAKDLLINESSEPNPTRISKERRERLFVWVSLAFACGLGWYPMSVPDPNPVVASVLLLCAIGFSCWSVYEARDGKNLPHVIFGGFVLFAIVETVSILIWNAHRREKERTEVHRQLSAHMDCDPGEPAIRSIFAWENGSESTIRIDKISGNLIMLRFGRPGVGLGGQIDHSRLNIWFDTNSLIGSEGDGQSYPFLERLGEEVEATINGKHTPLTCADVVIDIDYRLTSQPEIPQQKQFRFATRPRENGVKWVKVAQTTDDNNYCDNALFQKRDED